MQDGLLAVGDMLTVVGDARRLTDMSAHEHGLQVERVSTAAGLEASLLSRTNGAVEIVIPPRSD